MGVDLGLKDISFLARLFAKKDISFYLLTFFVSHGIFIVDTKMETTNSPTILKLTSFAQAGNRGVIPLVSTCLGFLFRRLKMTNLTKQILESYGTHNYLKEAINVFLDKDPVDALNDAELLVRVLKAEFDSIKGGY